jgi:predicted PurR-regulated permease PerM
MKKFSRILSWIFSVLFFILFIVTIESISWIFFLGLSALLCPPLKPFLHKHNFKPKLGIQIIIGIAFFILGMAFLPPSEPDSTYAFKAYEIETNEESTEN